MKTRECKKNRKAFRKTENSIRRLLIVNVDDIRERER